MQHQQLRIYIAGPYTAPTADLRRKNVNTAIDVGLAVWKKGHVPFIPHLTHFIDERAAELRIPMSYDDYLAWDTEWLKTCDALLYIASSRGADLELENAKRLNLTIYYSVDEVPDVNGGAKTLSSSNSK
jgi:Domain of unknown function (DUF4406)